MTGHRVAVVLTTYAWDDFVERQYRRAAAASAGADVYIVADQTKSTFRTGIPNTIYTSEQELVQTLGIDLHTEAGWGIPTLLWWNLDCLLYRFFKEHPEYDSCVMLDYDAFMSVQAHELCADLIARDVDFVAERIKIPRDDWYWTEPHLGYCAGEQIEGRLLCIFAVTRSAAAYLEQRRRELNEEYTNGTVSFWPFCEVFVPVELKRGGFKMNALSKYGAIDHYGFRPSNWEGDGLDEHSFVHPVLDTTRYLRSITNEQQSLTDALRQNTVFGQKIRRFPLMEYAPHLWTEARKRLPRRLGLKS